MNQPSLCLLVIRSPNIDRAVTFYQGLGLVFIKHAHGAGPEHYTCDAGDLVFEIYPLREGEASTTSVRLGFRVPAVDDAVAALERLGAEAVSPPANSSWGRRAVLVDFDGHRVEIMEAH